MTSQALFRVDAGPTIGLGHLQRCVSLAAALAEKGWQCSFLAKRSGTAGEYLAAQGFSAYDFTDAETGSTGDAEETRDRCVKRGCTVVVVDSYAVDSAYLRKLRDAGLFVVAIDDLAAFPFPCQMVVNAGAHAPGLRYTSDTGDTQFLLGPQFSLLRPEFWNVKRRLTPARAESVLITMGGGAFGDAGSLIGLLDACAGDFAVTVIVGPLVADAGSIERAAQNARRKVTLAFAPPSMLDLMQGSDICISGGGQTVYELCCVGTPTIAIQLADNQAPSLAALEREGILVAVRNHIPKDALAESAAALPKLVGDLAHRSEMSERGQRLVDGQGARRVAASITEHWSTVSRHSTDAA